MGGFTRQTRERWAKGEERLGRQWPVWIFGLILYAGVGFTLLTRAHIPSVLHLVVFIMAAAVLSVTALRIEWGVLALALILPFSRPGITIGPARVFQMSGFNFALAGVVMAYVLRYLADPQFARKGPLIRRTRIDWGLALFTFLVVWSTLSSLNLGHTIMFRMRSALFLKELIMYFMWFYLIVTMVRTPRDLRQFAIIFAIAGLMASAYGMFTRLTGGAATITAGTMEEDLAAGAGGRMQGGWLGLDHPNMFAALLLMTVPIWFFAIIHIKQGIRRLLAEVAVINGFLGLLFTYSRSAWIGSFVGMGLVGLFDRKSLVRVVLFGVIFAIIAQTVLLFTINMNLVDVVISRFQQLETSTFSARPYIYKSAFSVIASHPWLGVGLGAFSAHAPPTPMGWVPLHSHNVYLSYAAEAGIPAALLFGLITLFLIVLSLRNVRRVARLPGYGFVAMGSCGALIAVTGQTMAVQIFNHRTLGFGLYALMAIVISIDRMIREGQFDDPDEDMTEQQRRASPWITE
ncbi:MAG: O-antigen ligase family protein [Candidatus Eisenbacteria bacterium]|nr:O-antigen ligase family protein [Candidatus Eisenbacteria bacterium]